jgi:hypothetical protein
MVAWLYDPSTAAGGGAASHVGHQATAAHSLSTTKKTQKIDA